MSKKKESVAESELLKDDVEEFPSTQNSSDSSVQGSQEDNQITIKRTEERMSSKEIVKRGKESKKPFMIAIAGGSASGKTTLAEAIIERLQSPWVKILAIDNFYKELNDEEKECARESNFNFDHPDAIDFDLLKEVLGALKEGNCVQSIHGAEVVIYEGIFAFHNEDINEMMDIKIFVETDADICLIRRLRRDISERGREMNGVLNQYLRFVKPAFDNIIRPGANVADIIVPRGCENFVAIDLIVKRIQSELFSRGYNVCGRGENRVQQKDDCNFCTEERNVD